MCVFCVGNGLGDWLNPRPRIPTNCARFVISKLIQSGNSPEGLLHESRREEKKSFCFMKEQSNLDG
jgi:hypothetical protein